MQLLGLPHSCLLPCFLDLDSHRGVDSLDLFSLFYKKLADIIAPTLSVIFRGFFRRGSFSMCWRSANVTAIPKGAPSQEKENFSPTSITRILSKVFEKLVSHELIVRFL